MGLLIDQPRNQALTTYAMCGFSSISTLAISIGDCKGLFFENIFEVFFIESQHFNFSK